MAVRLDPPKEPPVVRNIPTYPLQTIIRTMLAAVGVAFALYVVYLLRKPISWVLIAIFLAVALAGPVNLLNRRMRRGFAIAIVYLGLLLVPIGIAALVVPPLVTQGNNLIQNLPSYAQDAQDFTQKNRTLRKLEKDYNITQKLEDQAKKLPAKIGDAATILGDIGLGLVNSLFALFTILVLTAFLLGSGRIWADKIVELQPPDKRPRIRKALDHMSRAVGSYVGGALAQATVAGVTAWIMLVILGVPFAAALAIIVFFADLIPLVGATLGAILVAVVTLFANFPTGTIVWVIFSVIYQQVENTVIQPQIQRRAVDVHPFIVLVAVLFGSTLLGILGALVAIPVAASAQIAIREWWDYRHEVQAASIAGKPVEAPDPSPG